MWKYFVTDFGLVSRMVNLSRYLGCLRPLYSHKNERMRVNKTVVFSADTEMYELTKFNSKDAIYVEVFCDRF